MSTVPNDPFDESPAGAQTEAPFKKSRRGCFLGCAIVSGIVMLVCCGGGYWAMDFVSQQLGDQVVRQTAGDPVMAEHIGELETARFEWWETGQQSQQAKAEGKNGVMVFSIEGSKGSGQLLVDQDASNQPDFDSMTLVLEDGSRFPLAGSTEGSDDLDAQLDGLEDGISIDTGELVADPPASELDAPTDPSKTDSSTDESDSTPEAESEAESGADSAPATDNGN